ncbi:hypothetical protein PMAYCL1PPCAC_26271, partial [Pristionchus mayeri]
PYLPLPYSLRNMSIMTTIVLFMLAGSILAENDLCETTFCIKGCACEDLPTGPACTPNENATNPCSTVFCDVDRCCRDEGKCC